MVGKATDAGLPKAISTRMMTLMPTLWLGARGLDVQCAGFSPAVVQF